MSNPPLFNKKIVGSCVLVIIVSLLAYPTWQIFSDILLIMLLPANSPLINSDVFCDTISCSFQILFFLCFIHYLQRQHFFLYSPYTAHTPQATHFHSWRLLLSTPFIAFGFSGLSLLWLTFAENFLNKFSLFHNSLTSFNSAWSGLEHENYFFTLCSLVLLGPIVEELLFRGILYNAFKKIHAGWFPILASSLLFGIWHMEPVQSVYTGFMAIGLGLIYHYTEDLRYPILIHIFNNLYSTPPASLDTDTTYQITNTLGLIMILPTLLFMYYLLKKYPVATTITYNKK